MAAAIDEQRASFRRNDQQRITLANINGGDLQRSRVKLKVRGRENWQRGGERECGDSGERDCRPETERRREAEPKGAPRATQYLSTCAVAQLRREGSAPRSRSRCVGPRTVGMLVVCLGSGE